MPKATRKIIHVDMDAFYASVEQHDNPALRGKPIAVGGSAQRGVVAAASYEARAFGVRSAMPSVQAKKRCPDLIFVTPRFTRYREVSNTVRDILRDYTDIIEPLSLDEAYLDVTENKKHIDSAIRIAMHIRRDIQAQTGLTASAGVSINKFLAKIASDLKKPNGLSVILPDQVQSFIDALAIEKFYGIGKATAQRMHDLGIFTGRDLRRLTLEEMVGRFGKSGRYYYKAVRGEDDRPVQPNRIRKSMSSECTYAEDLTDIASVLQALDHLSAEVSSSLQDRQIKGRTVTIKVRYADFTTLSRSKSASTFFNDEATIQQISRELIDSLEKPLPPIRLLGVGMSNLDTEIDGDQLTIGF